ncbi:extracellular solute-binding protein [Oceanicoccus sagamiensis]|uniref:Fe(3+) ABC transporter substrate-binding protein n=1 Tax=Oceanicoccus sagamiensis TaxID=716816 RepID=A0A1X9NDR8_9GAMM|nr:extracellular solute-binding protein [Oceanicoccus sagamiensis]ARN73689.1 Fe(3+) ABC transporter substrate-binding protein [Oceanicoccus sagamiensis]
MRHGIRYSLLFLLVLLVACSEPEKPAPELLVYSARNEHLIKPLFDRFTEQTGIVVNYVTDKAGPLLTRLQAEGENSPADLLMTVDAGNLWQANEVGVLAPVESAILNNNVPPHLRGADNSWFSLTIRARTMVYNTDTLSPTDLSTYEALAAPEWKGRLCLRTSKKVYNQSLVATMIAALGEEQTEQIVAGWVNNLAIDPLSNDTKVMEAVALGQCEVGIVNTYYYGRLMKKKPATPLALFWPNQQGEGAQGRGVHVNVSGVGITRASQHKALAQQLIEWLTTPEAQQILMDLNQEYPVNSSVEMNAELQAWGAFKGDQVDVSEAGRLQAAAVKLMDRAGYR